jgi:hypothetical protein
MEKLMNHLAKLPDEHLIQVLDFIRSITPEGPKETSKGQRFRLRDILRQAGPELFNM